MDDIMSKSFIVSFSILFFAMIGWNVFLASRDIKMWSEIDKQFDSYCEQLEKNSKEVGCSTQL
jgi:hypothetical protein